MATAIAGNNFAKVNRDVEHDVLSIKELRVVDGNISGVRGPILFPTPVAPTVFTASGALARNTFYTTATTTALAMTIAAGTNVGDWIKVLYTAAIDTTVLHTYTAASTFSINSHLLIRGEDNTRVTVSSLSVSGNNRITLRGLSNGDCGVGTELNFLWTGSTWTAKVDVLGQGAMSAASATTGFSTV